VTYWQIRKSEERLQSEARVNDYDADDISNPPPIDTIGNAFPSFTQLTTKDQVIKELCMEVLKMRPDMKASQAEVKGEIKELHDSFAVVKKSLHK